MKNLISNSACIFLVNSPTLIRSKMLVSSQLWILFDKFFQTTAIAGYLGNVGSLKNMPSAGFVKSFKTSVLKRVICVRNCYFLSLYGALPTAFYLITQLLFTVTQNSADGKLQKTNLSCKSAAPECNNSRHDIETH